MRTSDAIRGRDTGGQVVEGGLDDVHLEGEPDDAEVVGARVGPPEHPRDLPPPL
jgi:hypothetical protein